ncbi:MAG: sulfotransferase domain-containing protein [Pseudomonadota bacterium]
MDQDVGAEQVEGYAVETFDPSHAISVGVYSFPRSGNRWLRTILAAGMGIPDLPEATDRFLIDLAKEAPLRRGWHLAGRDWFFYKSHHKQIAVDAAGDPVPTNKVIYIHRDPLDVFVSYLNFLSKNVDNEAGRRSGFRIESVDQISEAQMERLLARWIADATLFPNNKKFGGYFEHVGLARARAEAGEPIFILRYEDLKQKFDETVTQMFDFLDLPGIDTTAVFDLADVHTKRDGRMAWKRKSGTYREYLTEDQIRRFALVYADELAELGYSY